MKKALQLIGAVTLVWTVSKTIYRAGVSRGISHAASAIDDILKERNKQMDKNVEAEVNDFLKSMGWRKIN